MVPFKPLDPPYTPQTQAQFDAFTGGAAPPIALFRILAAHERAWAKFRGGALLDVGPLSLREREIVIDRTCALGGCEYEWGVHVRGFAAQAGLDEVQVRALTHETPGAACWTESERALIVAVDMLHARGYLDPEEVSDLVGFYTPDQVLEIIQLCGFYRTLGALVSAFDLAPEPWAARFPAA